MCAQVCTQPSSYRSTHAPVRTGGWVRIKMSKLKGVGVGWEVMKK